MLATQIHFAFCHLRLLDIAKAELVDRPSQLVSKRFVDKDNQFTIRKPFLDVISCINLTLLDRVPEPQLVGSTSRSDIFT